MKVNEYLFLCLGEEASEISQAVSKLLRFGPDERYGGTGFPSNFERLEDEINDFFGVLDFLAENGFEFERDWKAIERKKTKIKRYLEISKQLGTVDKDDTSPN